MRAAGRQLAMDPDDCPDALVCPHQPVEPSDDYWRARAQVHVAAVAMAFPGLPRAHLNSIWRARQEHPEKRRELRGLRRARSWLRRR